MNNHQRPLLSPSPEPSSSSAAGSLSPRPRRSLTERLRLHGRQGQQVRSGRSTRQGREPTQRQVDEGEEDVFSTFSEDINMMEAPTDPSPAKASRLSPPPDDSSPFVKFSAPSADDPSPLYPVIQSRAVFYREEAPSTSVEKPKSTRPWIADVLDPTNGLLSASDFDDGDEDDVPGLGPLRALISRVHDRHLDDQQQQQQQQLQHSPNQPALLVFQKTPSSGPDSSATAPKRLSYLPLCPLWLAKPRTEVTNDLTVLPSHRKRIADAGSAQERPAAIWQKDTVPTELFNLITNHLARDDIKSMRLVSREFEQKVSRSLFYTSVVPFNTEIYDMIDEDRKTVVNRPLGIGKGKGKGRAMPDFKPFAEPTWPMHPPSDDFFPEVSSSSPKDAKLGGLSWQNAKEDKDGKVYRGHGLRVFQGFGPYIKRFGMSFEVSEQQLSEPPSKKNLDRINAYHGTYDWPPPQYTRFSNLAGLERTADETSRMKAAMSNLTMVSELALSIDSGLGWLNGPDKSFHARLFERPSAVFGKGCDVPDHALQEAQELWSALQKSSRALGDLDRAELVPEYRPFISTPASIKGLSGTKYAVTDLWSSIDGSRIVPATPPGEKTGPFGVITLTPADLVSREKQRCVRTNNEVTPANLQKEQKEWLMETEWAQRAFLESYMLAVIDNPVNFAQVTTLKFAKMSSRYLSMLSREHFWNALPCLKDVTLHVKADWRTVEKDSAGFAAVHPKEPSEALHPFYRELLSLRIAPRQSIKKLDIGWIGGGEYAEGMFARNALLLPAPITELEDTVVNQSESGICLPHVEHLTLTNCWITPTALEELVQRHADKSLKKLTLDSVSLTVLPPNSEFYLLATAHAAAQAQAHAAFLNAQFGNQTVNAAVHLQQLYAAAFAQHGAHGGLGNHAANAAQPQQQNPAQSHWSENLRPGSWPHVLDIISPGRKIADYSSPPPSSSSGSPNKSSRAPQKERNFESPQPPPTGLRTLELKSCGYAKLCNANVPNFDQSVLDPPSPPFLRASPVHPHNHPINNAPSRHYNWGQPNNPPRNRNNPPARQQQQQQQNRPTQQRPAPRPISPQTYFYNRASALKPMMLEYPARERFLGTIVQNLPGNEQDCMMFVWGFQTGWVAPEMADRAMEPVFDGFERGGTGRVSGVIQAGNPGN